MKSISRLARLAVLALLAAQLGGCVVLPFGGRGHYERYQGYDGPRDSRGWHGSDGDHGRGR